MILFFTENIQFTFPKGFKGRCRKLLSSIANDFNFKIGNLNIVILSDEQLLEVNKQYLNHNYYTDIITFDYTNNSNISGDLYISIDRVRENSKSFNCTVFDEIKRVIVHGMLHLVGFSDDTKENREQMRQKEDYYLERW